MEVPIQQQYDDLYVPRSPDLSLIGGTALSLFVDYHIWNI